MPLLSTLSGLVRLAAPLPIWHAGVSAIGWITAARTAQANGASLVSLWGSSAHGLAVHVAYALPEGLVWLELALDQPAAAAGPSDAAPAYPDLVPFFPSASRMQRATADLLGIRADGASDTRAWLNHGAWPADYFPLRDATPGADAPAAGAVTDYAFLRVEGDGVHEIPVGPVHAGIIEPGHFRFSVVGEKLLRLEQRLGYTHKGIERRFTQLAPLQAHRLAGRMSGDSTVAGSWAYCMALEAAAAHEVPARAACLRAVMLERERVANHLGDLGALGNDAAFGFGLAQFSRLREDWLRLSSAVWGHRLLMDCVLPGGVARDLDADALHQLRQQCDDITREVAVMRAIYDEHDGLQDRFLGTGQVTPALAAQLGLTGLAGRASGQSRDLRCQHAWPPYDRLGVAMATHRNGDVAARAIVRFDELGESLRLIHELAGNLPEGPIRAELQLPRQASIGAGWVEGWRGPVFVALELGGAASGHAIRRCHCHDPSWHNWPVLEHAVMGNIVPDFPLINKSFNLSYSGHDS